MATLTADKPKAPDKPASPPDAKDDLKSLPLLEVEKRLDTTPDGLSDAEAKSGLKNTVRTRSLKRKPVRS